jgi:hypothetical protein
MTADPADIPLTVPLLLTVATAALLLLHVPPVTASLITIVPPAHTDDGPVIVPAVVGSVTTDTVVVA